MGISKIKPLTSQYHSVGGSRGRGLLCLAPQLVVVVMISTTTTTTVVAAKVQKSPWTDF